MKVKQLDQFEVYRPLMFSIAYRMLGSAMDAEDIVQEAFLRYRKVDPDSIRSHKAFLATIVTRLSINRRLDLNALHGSIGKSGPRGTGGLPAARSLRL